MEAKRGELIRLLTMAQGIASELQEYLDAEASFRGDMIKLSKQLTYTLQTPVDRAWELFYQPFCPAAMQTAIDAGWLAQINANSTDDRNSTVTADQLADSTSSDPSVVKRLLRLLASNHIIDKSEINGYNATPFSKLFDAPEWANGLRHSVRDYSITMAGMPAYFVKTHYHLKGVQEGIYKEVHGVSFLERVRQGGEVGAQFSSFMGVVRAGKTAWFSVYPVEKNLRVLHESSVLLVDVGGGKGHDLVSFSQFKDELQLKGTLVLQDVPAVLTHVPTPHRDVIDVQSHDFFTPQKIFGARAYFLKHVLHDWPNEDCVRILAHLRDAMVSGYSRLLINEIVLSDQECEPWAAAFDITMMAVVGGKERSASEWQALIGETGGLAVERIWSFGSGNESIIEVVRNV